MRTLRLSCDAYTPSLLQSLVNVVVSCVKASWCEWLHLTDAFSWQSLDLSGSLLFSDANFWSLPCLRSVNFSGCKHVTIGTVFSLPPAITSISLGNCEHLEVDDAFLARVSMGWCRLWGTVGALSQPVCPLPRQIGATFPALCHLSLFKTLVSEVEPAFRFPGAAIARHRRLRRHGALAALPLACSGDVAANRAKDHSVSSHVGYSGSDSGESGASGEDESDAGDTASYESGDEGLPRSAKFAADVKRAPGYTLPGPATDPLSSRERYLADPSSWWERYRAERRASLALRWSDAGLESAQIPPHTSVAGWASLIRGLSHGLFSLDVRSCALSFASYSLLNECVAELRASIVLSPEAAAVAATRRRAMSVAREAKRVAARAAEAASD